MAEEYGEVYALPGDDPAVLFTFSDVIEVNVRTEDEYVESSIFPDEGLAILVHPLYSRLVRMNKLAQFSLCFQR